MTSSHWSAAARGPCTTDEDRRRFDPEFAEFQYHMRSGPWAVVRPVVEKLERLPSHAFKMVRRAERLYKMTRVLTNLAVDGVRQLGSEWSKMEMYEGRW